MKRFSMALALLLAAIMVFAACGETHITGEETTKAAVQTQPGDTNADGTTEAAETKAVPEIEIKKFDNKDFVVLCSRWSTYVPFDYVDISPENETGEVLNDAAWKRKSIMAEKYGINVVLNQTLNGQASPQIQKHHNSGESPFDLYLTRGSGMVTLVSNGYIVDLNSLSSIESEKPWWNQNSAEALTINGKMYGMIGDTTTNYLMAVDLCLFNKKIITDYKLENPYELVNGQKWTIDKLLEMSKVYAADKDGDGQMTNLDNWGINYTRDEICGILHACGIKYGQKNADGEYELIVNETANITKMQEVLTKLFAADSGAVDTLSNTGSMKAKTSNGEFFANGNVLFMICGTHNIGEMRQMDINFGMLPLPKFNDDDVYRSAAGGNFTTITTIPASAADKEASAFFAEMLAYHGYEEVHPAFYNNILQGKVAQDVESTEMLDFIFDNVEYDPFTILAFGGIVSYINQFSVSQQTSVASALKQLSKSVDVELKKFNNAVK